MKKTNININTYINLSQKIKNKIFILLYRKYNNVTFRAESS